MKENFLKASQNLIFGLVIATAVIAPLFFLPTTSEFFEFNKFTAILIITIIGLLIWAARMIAEKKAVFTRTPLDIPILILLAVFFIATLSSVDQFISLVGAHGRLWPAFFPLITIAAFYFLAVSNLKSKKQVNIILWTLIGATTLASVIAIISYFGAFLPFDFAKIRSFNPLGIANRLALLEAFVVPVAAAWAIFEKDKAARVIATIATLIMVFSFILINFLPAYIGLIAALLFLSIGTLKTKLDKNQQSSIAVLAVFIFLFLVLRFVPQVARGTLYDWIAAKNSGLTEQQQIDTPKEKTLKSGPAWDVATQAMGKRPLFGTGLGTYQFAYTQLKPRYMNGSEDWAIRFDKSNSDFTEFVTTTGVVGTLAYLLLIVAIARFLWTLIIKSQNTLLYLPIAAAIIGYIIASFFTVSSFATTIPFFIGLALISVLAKAADENHVYEITVELATLKSKFAWFPLGGPNDSLIKTELGAKGAKSQILPVIFLIVVAVASFFALAYQLNAYRAEYFYRQSIMASLANDGGRTVGFIQKAIAANPRIDTYHRVLSQTALNAAINLSVRGNLTESERQLLGQLAQVAIDQAKVASGYQILPLRLPGISAANVANWEALSAAYQALIGSIGGADVHATNTLAQAVSLDPENAILHDRLGILYQRLNNPDLAQRKFEDATIVKSDFGPAHYHLAKILIEKKGDITRIVNELALAKRFLPANDPAIEDIDKNLETYNKQLQELQEKAASQAGQPQASPSPSPEATPKATPTPTPVPSPSALPTPSF